MKITWNDKEPIYRQLHDRLVDLILSGAIAEGEALPSIREISSEHRINHITVSKSLQMLVDRGLIEKRRGVGMFVAAGAVDKLAANEREKFLAEEWPQVCAKVARLQLPAEDLIASLQRVLADKEQKK